MCFLFSFIIFSPPLKFCIVWYVLLFGVLALAPLSQTSMFLTSFYQTVGPSKQLQCNNISTSARGCQVKGHELGPTDWA